MAMEKWRPGRGLIPWRPFRELEELERRFEDIFGPPFLPSVWRRLPIEERGWAPPIEVFEKEDKFVVKAEVPGMKEDDSPEHEGWLSGIRCCSNCRRSRHVARHSNDHTGIR